MTGLDDLSTEVLAEIINYLIPQEDGLGLRHCSSKPDLYNLSLCSRGLHNVVETPLYSRIHGIRSVAVALTIRTFLDRPRLASLVREAIVEVKQDAYVAPTNDELMGSFGFDGLSTAVESACICGLERVPWVADFKAGRSDAREALLLSMLPNLRTLTLDVYAVYSPLRYINHLTQCVSERAMSWRATAPSSTDTLVTQRESTYQHALVSLRDVRIQAVSSLDYDETLPIMNLPSLHRLYTYGLSTSHHSWETPPESSVVRDLELDGCEMNEDELFWMLRSCRTLRMLEYAWDQSAWSGRRGAQRYCIT